MGKINLLLMGGHFVTVKKSVLKIEKRKFIHIFNGKFSELSSQMSAQSWRGENRRLHRPRDRQMRGRYPLQRTLLPLPPLFQRGWNGQDKVFRTS